MEDILQFVIFPSLGVLFGAGFIALTRWSGLNTRQIYAYGLIAAAFVYVALAGRSDNPTVWLGFEMTGVAIFGSLAMLSVIGSRWWLVAGYALHPLWLIVFHYIGAGSAFIPKELTLANTGFDLTLAAFLVYEAWSEARVSARAGASEAPISKRSRSK